MSTDIRDAVVELVNRLVDERLHDAKVSVTAFLPLRNGSLIPADRATEEHWIATRNSLLAETLEKVEPLLEDLVTLAVSHSIFLARQSPRDGST